MSLNPFEMNGYMNKYAVAYNRLRRLGREIEAMRSTPPEDENALAALQAAESEYAKLKAEVDDLFCLANYGRHRAELDQEGTFQPVRQFGGFYSHWPEPPKPRKLP